MQLNLYDLKEFQNLFNILYSYIKVEQKNEQIREQIQLN